MWNNLFTSICNMTSRTMTIERRGISGYSPISIKVCYAGYARNLQVVDKVMEPEREFVISLDVLTEANVPQIKRGDVIKDSSLGSFVISSVSEMIFLGNLVGYRVRTS